ncbi:unnamed protein product [Albugo candida]|uniref:Peptidase C1A papain C-terminal domain-containing protein n=1 Tax=Albugo candida TaxID=65357 RepID=A0A024GEP8_9STRA|nr:unnamed protein product [Albugo candida]|eukprot:CCI45246.1 unnamed protein product [Albugo candida]
MIKELQNGPIICGIACNKAFTLIYSAGIMNDTTGCMELDHDVEIVGWGEENGIKYWHIRKRGEVVLKNIRFTKDHITAFVHFYRKRLRSIQLQTLVTSHEVTSKWYSKRMRLMKIMNKAIQKLI